MDENNIKIIGTHHFQDKKDIEEHIDSFNPDIILIELCNGRISMMNNPEQKQKQKFSILGLISKSVNKKRNKGG